MKQQIVTTFPIEWTENRIMRGGHWNAQAFREINRDYLSFSPPNFPDQHKRFDRDSENFKYTYQAFPILGFRIVKNNLTPKKG